MIDLGFDVSRETYQRLEQYVQELLKWNKRINLVGRSTTDDVWQRHILDSAQLFPFINANEVSIADFGTGAGLPGIVLSILTDGQNKSHHMQLVESDQRKAAFLRHIIATIGLNCTVHAKRIEQLEPLNANLAVSRALASLDDLINHAALHLRNDGRLIALKGRNALREIEEAQKSWLFDIEIHPSITDNESAILSLTNISAKQ